ncbi:MAG: PhzF family phenazine biosynthesis protein [Gemmatimonadota bacterium]
MRGSGEGKLAGALRYLVVDAFTDRAFSGNPAAVVLPPPDEAGEGIVPDPALQSIAAEMNLSETAFPSHPEPDGTRRLRWFTPTTEVTLCGHATLAAAHALLEEGLAKAPLRFTSLSGPLTVHREEDGRLRLDFPADPPAPAPAPAGLMAALGLPQDTPFLTGIRCAVVPVGSVEAMQALAPEMGALARVQLPAGVMGVSVVASGQAEDADFVSRFFGPWVGVPEDPVTGMAHTTLGPYWAGRTGQHEMEARQASVRGGRLTVRVDGDRVHLVGRAVTVARGELLAGG